MVIRVAVGGYIHGGLYHSQSIDGFFTHIPGVRVVFPSNAADAKGLLKTACREDDPVLFLEHKGLYRQGFAVVARARRRTICSRSVSAAVRKREGRHHGDHLGDACPARRSTRRARIGAKPPAASIEVIDLRTLNPLDRDTILGSVRKTGKVLIVHEDTLTGGFGAEIAGDRSPRKRSNGSMRRCCASLQRMPPSRTGRRSRTPCSRRRRDLVEALARLAKY